MPRYMKQMTEDEKEKALLFVDTTIQSLLKVVESPQASGEQVERAYDLLAESVIAKARITSMKGVTND